MRLYKNLFKSSIFFVILFTIIMSYSALCLNSKEINKNKAEIDISNYDISDNNIINLDGKWEFYPNKLLTYKEIETKNYYKTLVNIPSKWNDYKTRDNSKMGAFGYGTFRLKVKNNNLKLSEFKILNQMIFGSYKIFIDDKVIMESGSISTKRNSDYPDLKMNMSEFESKKNNFNIIIQVSNYVHGRGGLRNTIYLGSPNNINYYKNYFIFKNSLIIGILAIITFSIFIMYIIYRKKLYMLAFLFALLLIIRSIFVGKSWLSLMGVSFNYIFLVYTDYITALLIIGIYTTIFYIPLKNSFSKKVYLSIISTITLIIFISLMSPINFLTNQISYILYMLITIIPIYTYWVLRKEIKNDNKNAYILLIFNIYIHVFAIHDILLINGKGLIDFQLLPTVLIVILLIFMARIYLIDVKNKIYVSENKKVFSILDSLPTAILEINLNNEIIFVNNTLRKEFNLYNINKKDINIEKIIDKEFLDFIKMRISNEGLVREFQKKINEKIFQITFKKKVIKDTYNILIIFDERTKEIKYGKKLEKVMNNLESTVSERTKSLKLFKDMITSIADLGELISIKKIDEDDFLCKIFNIGYDLIDKINAGSIYLFEDSKVRFIDSKGHKLEILNDLSISVLDFAFPTNSVRYVKNITKETENRLIEGENPIAKKYSKGVVDVKESVLIGLSFNNKIVGGISFEITTEDTFDENEKEIIRILANILNSYYKNFKSQKIKVDNMECEKMRLRNELRIDSLTGISNKMSLSEVYDKYWKRSLNEDKLISIIMIDIDNFKNYNDTYGHVRGDFVLKEVAKAISYDKENYVARYGGEEFIALIYGINHKKAIEIAEAMREKVELLNIENYVSYKKSKLTISLGVATARATQLSSRDSLIQRADKNLYIAKNNGKNQVIG